MTEEPATPAKTGIVIRDGREPDIAACLQLDHQYVTDYVWQMRINDGSNRLDVTFVTEHLPRLMSVEYPADERRLRLALGEKQCFLVAERRENSELLGYLTLQALQSHAIALVQDVVVSRHYRRRGIGTRLLNVARRWAQEHGSKRLILETQTKNYPGIAFCQHAGLTFCGFNDQYFANQDIAVFFGQPLR